MKTATTNFLSHFRQPVSGLTHLTGFLLSIPGLIWLITGARAAGNRTQLIASLIFGVTMVLLYAASSTYHLVSGSEALIQRLRRFDHSSIFLFIAGSYTPFCVGPLKQGSGTWLLIVAWSAAAIGIGIRFFPFPKSRWLTAAAYLIMGWMAVVVLPEIWRSISTDAFIWFAAGGIIYTLGAVVYATKKPDPVPEVFGFHEIWHLFSMAGSFCHYWVVRHHLF